MGRAEQAAGVLLQAEDRRPLIGLVGAHALEHAHAVMQGMRQDMGLRLAPGHEFSVHPDHAVTIGHRHACVS